MKKSRQLCEYEGCTNVAVGWVEAQWTIVDFCRFETCLEHMNDMCWHFYNQTVEGEHAYIGTGLYED